MTELPDLTRSRAVLIGTTASVDAEVPATPGAASSLAGMRAVLTNAELCGWPEENVAVVQDTSDITGLSLTLRRLAREAAEVLLVYFAGQGLVGSRGEFCLSLAGTLREDAEDTSLRYARVRQEVLDSRARLKIVILDCPYSGHVITGLSGTQVADLTSIHGACVITASEHETGIPATVDAYDGAMMTPFTAELIATIRSGIAGGPADVTLDDIYSGLVVRLRNNGLPEPSRRNIDLAGQFSIARNAAYKPGQHPLARGPGPGVALDQVTAPRPGLLGRRRVIGVAAVALVAGATGSTIAVTHSHANTPTNPPDQGAGITRQPDRTLTGPTDQVFNVAFTPDDRFLAAASRDTNAWIWDVTNQGNNGMPLPHHSPVQAVAFSHDGRLLATGSADGKVRLWETSTWTPIKFSGRDYIIKHEFAAWDVAFSPDDALLVSGTSANATTGPGKTVALCDVTRRRAPVFLPHPDSVGAFAFSPPGGSFLLTGSNNKYAPDNMRKWEVATGQLLYARPAGGAVAAIAYQPNRPQTFFTGGWDGTLRRWNLASDSQIGILGQGLFRGTVTGVSFNHTGDILATASTDFVRLWDTKEWRVTRTIYNKETAGVSYNHAGTWLASPSGYLVVLRDMR